MYMYMYLAHYACSWLVCFLDADVNLDKDHETLLLTVESLKAQLEEQTRLCKEQVRHKYYAFS